MSDNLLILVIGDESVGMRECISNLPATTDVRRETLEVPAGLSREEIEARVREKFAPLAPPTILWQNDATAAPLLAAFALQSRRGLLPQREEPEDATTVQHRLPSAPAPPGGRIIFTHSSSSNSKLQEQQKRERKYRFKR
jgi:hypothetical protein